VHWLAGKNSPQTCRLILEKVEQVLFELIAADSLESKLGEVVTHERLKGICPTHQVLQTRQLQDARHTIEAVCYTLLKMASGCI